MPQGSAVPLLFVLFVAVAANQLKFKKLWTEESIKSVEEYRPCTYEQVSSRILFGVVSESEFISWRVPTNMTGEIPQQIPENCMKSNLRKEGYMTSINTQSIVVVANHSRVDFVAKFTNETVCNIVDECVNMISVSRATKVTANTLVYRWKLAHSMRIFVLEECSTPASVLQ
ncbi:hypothetical protein QR680_011172 [Steinernema hermaphroditum]|uniref:Uncharacterized protein n=1 Tax=Steinernema hermaphroditum TaxID=289476 RepID=A0AA39ISK2_9BILA|nr:hypothetical protein QR680_011172 [Steinernema hermaphroditum]